MTKRAEQDLIRILLWNAFAGAMLGVLFAAFLVYWDVAAIGTLIARSDQPAPALLLLFGGFAVTFGSAVCGTAIMGLSDVSDDRDDGPGGGRRELIPIRVRARRD
ncbi:MAG: hypothetical protein JWN07_1713 [Hyphomicrobiales bacterium]|jgi:hypothetical protein|nr:hypothetical protein [Hyphomicrobiales bacterium]